MTKIAAYVSRFTRFSAVRNFGSSSWKKITITTSPASTGSAPLSPLRILLPHAAKYSPSEPARTSGDAAVSASSVSAGGGASSTPTTAGSWASGAWVVLPGSSMVSLLLSSGRLGRRRGADGTVRGAGGHVVDDTLAVELG